MDEKLYTIPVNDAFMNPGECPVCAMRTKLENDAVEYTLGPSYMEDDIRMVTDKMGFCDKHIDALYKQKNRLGLALILSTHFARTNKEIEKLQSSGTIKAASLFKKGPEDPVVSFIDKLDSSCFICDRINDTFDRYVKTIFYMYKNDNAFVDLYGKCNGFCTRHYGLLLKEAPKHLNSNTLGSFVKVTNSLYLENMKRVQGDLEWFVDKFDYRYANEPWKNSKDAIPRAITKTNSIAYDTEKK